MTAIYGRDLDLNLLRVFAVVAETGSVTGAAARLYLTQPAVSASLKRLATAVGAPLFARQGRGLVLTTRGQRLFAAVRPHLEALVVAALSAPRFDPRTSERTVRLGLADAAELWLLPALLRALEREAPGMKLIVVPVQFRTVADALSSQRVDIAITVADELPAGVRRAPLYRGSAFVCLFDPRHVRLPKRGPSVDAYFALDHVIVSYNADMRGLIEDVVGRARRARCSVGSFHNVGAIVDGGALVATVPATVAREIVRTRRHLRTAPVPFEIGGTPTEILWRDAIHDDDACAFVRKNIERIAAAQERA